MPNYGLLESHGELQKQDSAASAVDKKGVMTTATAVAEHRAVGRQGSHMASMTVSVVLAVVSQVRAMTVHRFACWGMGGGACALLKLAMAELGPNGAECRPQPDGSNRTSQVLEATRKLIHAVHPETSGDHKEAAAAC